MLNLINLTTATHVLGVQVSEESSQCLVEAIAQVAACVEVLLLPNQQLGHVIAASGVVGTHGESYLGGGPAHIQRTNWFLKQHGNGENSM